MVDEGQLIEAVEVLPALSRIAVQVLPVSSIIEGGKPVVEQEQALDSAVEPVQESSAAVVFPVCETTRRWVPWGLAAVLAEQVVLRAVAA